VTTSFRARLLAACVCACIPAWIGGCSADAASVSRPTTDTSRAQQPPDTSQSQPPTSPPPFPIPASYASSAPAAGTYVEAYHIYQFYDNGPTGPILSRFIFHADSTFDELFSYPKTGASYDVSGVVVHTDSTVRLAFSASVGWTAMAVIHGDTLNVYYNQLMQLTDFVDGPYLLSR
jgi:hypothetical protein